MKRIKSKSNLNHLNALILKTIKKLELHITTFSYILHNFTL